MPPQARLRQPPRRLGFLGCRRYQHLAHGMIVHKRTNCRPFDLQVSPKAQAAESSLWGLAGAARASRRFLQGLRKLGTMKTFKGSAAIVRLELPRRARIRRAAIDPDAGTRDV